MSTGASTLLVLAALLLLGGDSLADFALALVLGIVVGTVSTISVAVPLIVSLEQRGRHRHPRLGPTAPGPAGTRRSDGAVV